MHVYCAVRVPHRPHTADCCGMEARQLGKSGVGANGITACNRCMLSGSPRPHGVGSVDHVRTVMACRGDHGDLINVERAIGNLKASKAKERREEGGEEGEGRKKKGRVGHVKNRRVPKKSKAPVGKAGGKGGKVGVKGGGVGKKGKKGKKPQKG